MNNASIIISVFLAAAFPTTVALIGILLNRKDSSDIRSELSSVRERLTALEVALGVKRP
jgi:hypothetical protein